MKKFIPLLMGILSVYVILLLDISHKYLLLHVILFGTPIATYMMCDEQAGDSPRVGCFLGALIGCFLGAMLMGNIMNLIYHDTAKDSIRLDLILRAIVGASIISTLGIILGDHLGKQTSNKK